jgi:HSP20 family molecular chaperone IbpA
LEGGLLSAQTGHGKLKRTVACPAEMDPVEIHAALKEGTLKVTLPKIQLAERHTVKVA